jgi:hypothetical protein
MSADPPLLIATEEFSLKDVGQKIADSRIVLSHKYRSHGNAPHSIGWNGSYPAPTNPPSGAPCGGPICGPARNERASELLSGLSDCSNYNIARGTFHPNPITISDSPAASSKMDQLQRRSAMSRSPIATRLRKSIETAIIDIAPAAVADLFSTVSVPHSLRQQSYGRI